LSTVPKTRSYLLRNQEYYNSAGQAAFIIAAAIISLQTYRAATANPADSIRYD
jgi:hypothetical protein